MRNVWTIAKREFAHYFVSPIAYAVALILMFLLGLAFLWDVNNQMQQLTSGFGGGSRPSMETVFGFLSTIIMFLAPALTMRLMAEEQNKGTLELLLTAPVREWEIIIGKWLGVWLFALCLLIVTTIVDVLILFSYGNPDVGPIYSGYLGLALMIGAILALGLFASSLTGNLIVSVAVGYGFVVFIWIIGALSQVIQSLAGFLGGRNSTVLDVVTYINFSGHFQDNFLRRGTINTVDIVYFVSIVAVSLFLATRVVEARRWQ
jgi:ABC-2 type transport system permease protein